MNLPMSCSLNIEILIPEYIFVVLSSNTSVKIYRTKKLNNGRVTQPDE